MQTLFTNARLVLPDECLAGSLAVEGGRIVEVQPGRSQAAAALDMEGDFLIPGAVDLHTDNLERQVLPRPNARWPGRAAFLVHDAQCAAAGITTVLDALCVADLGFDCERPRTCDEAIADLDALQPAGLLKAEHFLHLRCEMPAPGMPEEVARRADHPALRMVSLMDHTPGTGQYADVARYRWMRAQDGERPADTEQRIGRLQAQQAALRDVNRAALLALFAGRNGGPVLASHDDETPGEVAANLADGVLVSEFPVRVVAARAARDAGMGVIAGAPNLVRGGSHTGNVGVAALLEAGLVDVLASDYVPASLVHAAFMAAEFVKLPRAIGLISAAPARMAGFADRGALVPGLRADLVRVRVHDGVPVVRAVYCAGVRVA